MKVNVGRLLQVAAPSKTRPASDASAQGVPSRGTVCPNPNFNGEQAALRLHDALRRDTDVGSILEVLASHNSRQRQAIKRHYRILSDKSLELDVYEYLGGNFRDVSVMLLKVPMDVLAENVHTAIQKVRPEVATLVELLWGHTNAELRQVKETYRTRYGLDLNAAVDREMDGDFRCLMCILLTTDRDESHEVDMERARKDAQVLMSAGVGVRYGTDDAVLTELLHRRGLAHLREMFSQFCQLSRKNIEDSVVAEFGRDLRDGLVCIVRATRDQANFLAGQIHGALIHPQDDPRLMRILVARSELDLMDIKDSYLRTYGVKLAEAVADVTSGQYRRFLRRLLGHYDGV